MKRRVVIKGLAALPTLTLADMPVVNANFRKISQLTGIRFEYVNCGSGPNAVDADSIHAGMMKISRNFQLLEGAVFHVEQ